MINGKCKEDFEKWLVIYLTKELPDYNEDDWDTTDLLLKQFYENITLSMQFGVYQDFANSAGYEVGCYRGVDQWLWFANNFTTRNHNGSESPTRQEARTKAIEKFNELYNAG